MREPEQPHHRQWCYQYRRVSVHSVRQIEANHDSRQRQSLGKGAVAFTGLTNIAGQRPRPRRAGKSIQIQNHRQSEYSHSVESCTNLAGSVWQRLQTGTLTNGSVQFNDPMYPANPKRFYRVSSP
jgi:hypothetical protein